jgi:hypothetical protein
MASSSSSTIPNSSVSSGVESRFPSNSILHFSKKKIEELLNKYPDRIPIIISSKSFETNSCNRFIVPLHMTIGQFISMLRNRTQIKQDESLFIFVKDGNKDVIAPSSESLGSLYEKYKDSNLILNLFYEKEAVFG